MTPGPDPALRIAHVPLARPLVLAPLASITTPAFRILCEEQGAALTWTEMVSVPGLVRHHPKIRALLRRSRPDAPFAVQLVGARPDEMERAAAIVAERGADLLDLNMGCPVKKVAKTGGGVALMRTPELAEALVRAARRGAGPGVGVTVKMRLGWDEASRNAPDLARRLVDAGACAITVHGRTRRQGFSGRCDLAGIRAVVQAVGAQVPVVGNGDVVDGPSFVRMRAETGCAAVMVGRAALGNPWVFAALRAAWQGSPAPPPPDRDTRLQVMRRHFALYLADWPEPVAVREIRKHLVWYSKGLHRSVDFRRRLQTTASAADVEQCIAALQRVPATR